MCLRAVLLHMHNPNLSTKTDKHTHTYAHTLTLTITQASGTALFTDDLPIEAGSLFAAFVCARTCKGKVTSINTEEALRVPGAVRFIGPGDVPGCNLVSGLCFSAVCEMHLICITRNTKEALSVPGGVC